MKEKITQFVCILSIDQRIYEIKKHIQKNNLPGMFLMKTEKKGTLTWRRLRYRIVLVRIIFIFWHYNLQYYRSQLS